MLARMLKDAGYHTASFTGFTFEQLLSSNNQAVHEFLNNLDILVDGPFILAERDLELRFRGSRNQRVLDVPASLKAGKPIPTSDPDWGFC
jgi:anaerobic ribonucleoside-triphosphate reductase activating protein